MAFLLTTNLKFHTKYQILDTLSAPKMGCYAARSVIHWCLSVWCPLLDIEQYLRELQIAYTSPLWSTLCGFCWKTNPEFHVKYQILGTLSALEIGCWAARRDTHWWLSESSTCLDIWEGLKSLLVASVNALYSTLCYSFWKLISNFMQENIRFWAPSQHRKWNAVL